MHIRQGFTLVESLVVLAILAGMIGLLLPAVQYARESARSAVCQNNIRQLGIAVKAHHELTEQFPKPGEEWTVTVLQWVEEKPLMEELKRGQWQRAIGNRPLIYKCPSQVDSSVDNDGVLTCHYVLEFRLNKGKWMPFQFRDRTQGFRQENVEPWYIGPVGGQMPENNGPHAGGRYNSS